MSEISTLTVSVLRNTTLSDASSTVDILAGTPAHISVTDVMVKLLA